MISCRRTGDFRFIGQALSAPKNNQKPFLTITFGLACRKESDRIDVAVEAYPNRWTHHVMIGSVEEVDEELLSWIAEAAEFAKNMKR